MTVLQWYMFPREMCAPGHISLVITVPRTIITRVRSFPLQKHPWFVFPSANGTDARYWQRTMEVLRSVFLHPSISRMEEDQYQAFFRYVSTKEYSPAVVDLCLWRRLLPISCRQIIHYMNTQIQEGGNDCGLFAIATACHYIMPWGGPSWLGVSISRVRCEVTSRLLRAIAMKTGMCTM